MPTPPVTDRYQLPFNPSRFGARFNVVDDDHPTPHRGTDFVVPEGTPIPAVANGLVVDVRWSNVLGWVTVTETRLRQKHDGSRSLFIGYCHQSKTVARRNTIVRRNGIIGLSGNTGSASSGPHLHLTHSFQSAFAVFDGKVFDPIPFIDAHDHRP